MPKLYEILGVTPNATPQRIRAAYRKLAKSAHPDAGGTPEQFEQLKLAHDVLLDPERRSKYDKTGQVDTIAPDNDHVATIQLMSGVLRQVLSACAQQGRGPTKVDLAAMMVASIDAALADQNKHFANMKLSLDALKKITGRWSSKSGAQQQTLIESVVHGQIAELTQFMSRAEANKSQLTKVRELLDDYKFRFDHEQVLVPRFQVFTAFT